MGYLVTLQESWDADGLPVTSLSVNEVLRGGTYLDLASEDNDLPLVQDTSDVGVWDLWGVSQRDLVILDGDNEVLFQVSLAQESLGGPALEAEVDALVREAAEQLQGR